MCFGKQVFEYVEFDTWDFVQLDTLEAPALLLPEYSNSCCYCLQKQLRAQSGPYQDNLMTGGVITVIKNNPFPDVRTSLSLLPSDSFQREQSNFVLKVFHVLSFYVLQKSFEKIYYTFAEEPDKRFCARLKEKTFAFVGKWLKH